jgi:SNF2 family DNA or RNA helicase
MGIGKTIQSLCISYMYHDKWPLLIICPSSLRLNWFYEIKKWFNNIIDINNIQIIETSKDKLKEYS